MEMRRRLMIAACLGAVSTGSIGGFPIGNAKINGDEIPFALTAKGVPISVVTGKPCGDQLSLLMVEEGQLTRSPAAGPR